jgi:integrase/recombinase XerC
MDTSQSNLHTWIDAYIQECKVQRQLSPHTVKNYQRQLEVVVKQTSIRAWPDLTPNIAKRILQQGNKDGLSARTINDCSR